MSEPTALQKTLKILEAVNKWQKNISLYNIVVKLRYPLLGGSIASLAYAYVKRDYWMPNTEEIRQQLHYESAANRELFNKLREEYHNKLAEELMGGATIAATQ